MHLIMVYIFMLLVQLTQINSQNFHSNKFELIADDSRLDALVILTELTSLFTMCAHLCLANSLCKSFNYHGFSGKCEVLSNILVGSASRKLQASIGWQHYGPTTESKCRQMLLAHKTSLCGPFENYVVDCLTEKGYRCDSLQNIALGKITQNEPFYHTSPSRAVDGNTATNFRQNSCTQTKCCSPRPWWRVDFGKNAAVYSMKITNRGDCCGERLSNFNVRIGDSTLGRGDENVACQMNASVPQGATSTFVCDPRLYGRYLYVQTNLNEMLTICEIEVFGIIL